MKDRIYWYGRRLRWAVPKQNIRCLYLYKTLEEAEDHNPNAEPILEKLPKHFQSWAQTEVTR